jgi:hypothetical protein
MGMCIKEDMMDRVGKLSNTMTSPNILFLQLTSTSSIPKNKMFYDCRTWPLIFLTDVLSTK